MKAGQRHAGSNNNNNSRSSIATRGWLADTNEQTTWRTARNTSKTTTTTAKSTTRGWTMYVPRNQQAAKKLIPAVCATHIHLHSPSYTCHAPRPRKRRATLGKACATCTCHNPFAVQDSPFVQLGRCALGTNFPQLQSFPKRFFFYLPALVFVVVSFS